MSQSNMKISFKPGKTRAALTITPILTATTLLSSSTPLIYGTGALGTGTGTGPGGVVGPVTLGSGVPTLNAINNKNYFTGRSDNFSAGRMVKKFVDTITK